MLQEIQLDILPQTFQDAIHITWKLGYRYVWIDSLCILQDDQDDWAYESSTMARIYSNSVLTIAALWGCDSDSGCFVERQPLEHQDCRIRDWVEGGLYVESNDERLLSNPERVNPAPLYYRAWVLQERLLSHRVLCYGPLQLHWECFKLQLDEMSPKRDPGTWGGPDNIKLSFKELERTRLPKAGDIYQQATCRYIYNRWSEIKMRYWCSDLTFESDVLVAFSGITTSMGKTIGMTNLYGLWAEFLALELLWSVNDLRNTVRSPTFPTWSWASVRGTDVRDFWCIEKWFEKDCRVQISVETIPSLGSLPDNQKCEPPRTLTLNGPIMSTALRHRPKTYGVTHYYPAKQPLAQLSVHYDHEILENREVYLSQIVVFHLKLDDPNIRFTDPLSSGLVLLPVEADSLTFQRVGTWDNVWERDAPGSVEDKGLKFSNSETILLV